MESESLPPQPIILNPALPSHKKDTEKRGFLGTFGLLLSGWLLGNLIIFAIFGIIALTVVGSTGLVKVPLVTRLFFGQPHSQIQQIDSFAYQSAQDKMTSINNLKKGEYLKELQLYQNELNALLTKSIQSTDNFPIGNPNLEINNDSFVFTGLLKLTNAPLTIKGTFGVSNLAAKVSITEARFGKIAMPLFVASNIIDSNLSKIGLTLSGGEIPAKEVDLSSGLVTLKEVVKPSH